MADLRSVARSTGTRCARPPTEAMRARLRAVLGLPGRRGRRWSTTAGSSSAATSRTPRTASGCAPSAGWSRRCTPRGGGRLVASPASTATATCSCRAAAAASCCGSTAGPDLLLETVSRRPADDRGAARRVRSRCARPSLDLTAPRGRSPTPTRSSPRSAAAARSRGTSTSGRTSPSTTPAPARCCATGGSAGSGATGEPADRLRAVQPAAPQPDDGERAAGAHPAAPAGRRRLQPRPRRAAAAAGRRARRRSCSPSVDPAGFDVLGGLRRAAARAGHRRAARRARGRLRPAAAVVAGHRADVRGGSRQVVHVRAGTPSSSAMTRTGSGSAYSATTSKPAGRPRRAARPRARGPAAAAARRGRG